MRSSHFNTNMISMHWWNYIMGYIKHWSIGSTLRHKYIVWDTEMKERVLLKAGTHLVADILMMMLLIWLGDMSATRIWHFSHFESLLIEINVSKNMSVYEYSHRCLYCWCFETTSPPYRSIQYTSFSSEWLLRKFNTLLTAHTFTLYWWERLTDLFQII